MKFEVIAVRNRGVTWVVMLYSLVGVYQRFGRMYCFHFQNTNEDGDSRFIGVIKQNPQCERIECYAAS
jgi:hypothetical protein